MNTTSIVVIVASFIMGSLLNYISEKKGWKNKAEKVADDKPYVRSLPIVMIAIFIIALFVLPKMGVTAEIIIAIQVITITLAVFFFELFR